MAHGLNAHHILQGIFAGMCIAKKTSADSTYLLQVLQLRPEIAELCPCVIPLCLNGCILLLQQIHLLLHVLQITTSCGISMLGIALSTEGLQYGRISRQQWRVDAVYLTHLLQSSICSRCPGALIITLLPQLFNLQSTNTSCQGRCISMQLLSNSSTLVRTRASAAQFLAPTPCEDHAYARVPQHVPQDSHSGPARSGKCASMLWRHAE